MAGVQSFTWRRWFGGLNASLTGRALELASRLGFAARGLVYVSVGAIALMAALDLTPRAAGAKAAVAAWAEWPAGLLLIWSTAIGLIGFSVWRGLQAVFDADRHGTSAKGWAVRAGQAISGVVHSALAFSLLELLDGLEDIGEIDEDDSAQTQAAALMELPHGDLMLIGVGLFILAVGAANIIQALFKDFSKRLRCTPKVCRWAVPLGRAGYFGRGVAMAPLGLFLVRAGQETRASEAQGLGMALQTLEAQPFGGWILALTALGLVAFGAFALVEARFRRIDVPDDLEHG